MLYENQQQNPGFFTNNWNRLQQIYGANNNNIWNTAKYLGQRGSLHGYGAARIGLDAARLGWNAASGIAGRKWTNYRNAMGNIKNFADANAHFRGGGGPQASAPRMNSTLVSSPQTPQPTPQSTPPNQGLPRSTGPGNVGGVPNNPQSQPQPRTQTPNPQQPNNLTQPPNNNQQSNNSGENTQQHRPPSNPQEAMNDYRRRSGMDAHQNRNRN